MTLSSSTYSEFSLAFHKNFENKRSPLEVAVEVTRRCPLECQHCYNNLPMSDLAARKRELTKEEYAVIFKDMAEMGVLWLLLTGGEIFARKDFLEIYALAKQQGFLITLFTNGILINEKIADHLREFPPFSIEITLYGRTRETYERLTGMPGSFDRCMKGIRLLLERGLPLKLKTVGTSINRHEVIDMRAFAERELGVEFKFDSLINPRIDCSHAPLGIRLSPEEVVTLDLHWPKVAAEHRANLDREQQTPLDTRETIYSCGGGLSAFAIDPYGGMSICVLSHQETYDLRKGNVREGWDRFLLNVRKRRRTRPSKCVTCRIRSVCSMCPANGELENGDPESPVDFLCEVAHLRALALGVEVPAHDGCELCNEPVRRQMLRDSAARIAKREVTVDEWIAPTNLLPVLNNINVATGCSGCGSH